MKLLKEKKDEDTKQARLTPKQTKHIGKQNQARAEGAMGLSFNSSPFLDQLEKLRQLWSKEQNDAQPIYDRLKVGDNANEVERHQNKMHSTEARG